MLYVDFTPLKNSTFSDEPIEVTLVSIIPTQQINFTVQSEIPWVQKLAFPVPLCSDRVSKRLIFQQVWNDSWFVPKQRVVPWIHSSDTKNWESLALLEVENYYWNRLCTPKKTHARVVDLFLSLLFSSAPRMQIQEYSDALKISQQYLNKSLRTYMGCSANALVQFKTLLEAKNRLVYGNLPIKAIAYELGFTELANFYNFFRKKYRFDAQSIPPILTINTELFHQPNTAFIFS